MGESLGTGVAAYLAGTQPKRIAGLVLLSPYDKLANIAQDRYPILPARFLLLDRFPSADYLRDYHGPLAVVVDGHDNVVPEKFGKRLYEGYAGPKRLWEFPQKTHVVIGEPPAQFWREVLDFWQAGHSLVSQTQTN
jgi:pimeloyl-ACP methyl ester carboxylesterase